MFVMSCHRLAGRAFQDVSFSLNTHQKTSRRKPQRELLRQIIRRALTALVVLGSIIY